LELSLPTPQLSTRFLVDMKFSTIASALLLAGTTIAAPGTSARRARALARKGNTNQKLENSIGALTTNKTNVQFSGNWAGAVLVSTGFTSVTGTFIAPSPTTAGSGSAWVGIDGDTCGSAILQTGIDWTRSGTRITYDAWYEWFPDFAFDFTGITISAGNSITVTVTATSTRAGTATIKNNTTGVTVTHSFSGAQVEASLCEQNAEWIVEDFESGSSLVPFANFGTVTFTGASAKKGTTTVPVTGATIIDLEQNTVLTNCGLVGTSGVTCTYV